ncbi:MAG: Hsp20 family protein [Alphaproteobacteria bacterium]|jgi:molecular chaperone IbpA|nr:Hsp20 family protein [Alphaproteobacteria bacterium]MCK5623299.1 Hsp20 family protein [Alphaproteobacteria bacterium]
MRTSFDFSPFARSTVGFDRMLRLLDGVAGAGEAPSYPPYNIAKTAEDQYEIAVAVAGFGEDELEVKVHDGQLTIKSTPEQAGKEEVSYLHRGIARRAFELRFSLADYIEVSGAYVENGMLHVELMRNVPEARKPRSIAIGKAGSKKALTAEEAA